MQIHILTPTLRILSGCSFILAACLALQARAQTGPANDLFANRVTLSGAVASDSVSNAGAMKEAGEPNLAGNPGGSSVWWRWVAPSNGTVTVDTAGSSFDTLAGVFTGASVSSLTLRASNDDIGTNRASRATFSATAGVEYQIVVDGYNGATGTVMLSVWEGPLPPSITTQPLDRAVAEASSVTFSVVASGASPLFYQWRKDGADISNATNANYTLSPVGPADTALYSVMVSNSVGSALSSNALLDVNGVLLTNSPRDLAVTAGYDISLNVGATGPGSFSYLWRRDTLPMANATNATCWIHNAQPGDAGQYDVVVSNPWNARTSSVAQLTVDAPYTFASFAGMPGKSGTNDGLGSAARFTYPHGLALDSGGNLYVTDIGTHTLRKITPQGVVSTLAGLPNSAGFQDGLGSGARFNSPWGVTVGDDGTIFVADTGNAAVRKVTPDGLVSTLKTIGGGTQNVVDVAAAPLGNVFVTARSAGTILKLLSDGTLVTPSFKFLDASVAFSGMSGLKRDAAGNLYATEEYPYQVVLKITPFGHVTSLAGTPRVSGSSDGVGAAASFYGPHGGAVDQSGNVFVADMVNNTVRKISPAGVVTTIGGSAGNYGAADGAGTQARFMSPRSVAVDALGNLYVTDFGNSSVRKGVPFVVNGLPQNQAVTAGTPVTLSVGAATGANGPFGYQWLFNGALLPAQTNLSLELGPLWRTNSGVYSVMVSNAVGNWLSFSATVRALLPPTLQSPSVSDSGTLRLRFQEADGGLPYDVSQVQVQWRSTLPSGSDTNWQVLASPCYATNGFIVCDDTNWVAAPTRFYRIVEQ